MKKNLLQKLQAALLLAALTVAGTAFLPEQSQAIQPGVCFEFTDCPDGNRICDVLFGPIGEEQAQLYVCTGPIDCV